MCKPLLIIVVLMCCNCLGGLARNEVVKHPDSSMQMLEFRNYYFGSPQIRIAVYNKQTNKMIVKGWIDADKLKYWTATKYDWATKIKSRE